MDDTNSRTPELRLNLGGPPAPVRFDREQLEASLRPVIRALERLADVMPEVTEQLGRIARAVEATEDRAAMAPRRKR